MKIGDERLLRDRFDRLAGGDDSDWGDVRRRGRRVPRKRIALGAALAALIAVIAIPGFGLGSRVIGLFKDEGKPVPLSKLSERDRQTAVFSLCRRLKLVSRPGQAPLERCLDGVPTIKEIANNGTTFYWKLRYPNGVTCLASGPVRGFRDPNRGFSKIGMMGCNVGSPSTSLVPTAKRPITADTKTNFNPRRGGKLAISEVSGLAGSGIASVGVVDRHGFVLKTPVKGRTYDLTVNPGRDWVAIVALDASGKEVYRQALPTLRRIVPSRPSRLITPRPAPLLPLPKGQPVQHGQTSAATIDVYPGAFVALHFDSTTSRVYRLLSRSPGSGVFCGDVKYGSGRWLVLESGSTEPLRQDIRAHISRQFGGAPSPPFDFCETGGMYGRAWNISLGTHELVEVPFTAIGRRYLDERAAARDLAHFVRSRMVQQIRLSPRPRPPLEALTRKYPGRVVELRGAEAVPQLGTIGFWVGSKAIFFSASTPSGRWLFAVAKRGTLHLTAANLRDLAFVF
jgi:hypothetical protein